MSTPSSRKQKNRGSWALRLFGLPFFLVGLGATYFVAREFVFVIRTAAWEATQATVVDVKLHTSRGSKGSTTYRVDPKFTYVVNGTIYTGDRVREADGRSGTDNIGSYHQDWHDRLSGAMASGSTVPAWYSPSEPHRAVLSRNIRWAHVLFAGLFMVMFGGIGAFLVFLPRSIRSSKRSGRVSKRTTDGHSEAEAKQVVKIFETPTDVQVSFKRGFPSGVLILAVVGFIFTGIGFAVTFEVWFGLFFVAGGLGSLYGAYWMWNDVQKWHLTTETLELHRRLGAPKQIKRSHIGSISDEVAYLINDYPYYKFIAGLRDGTSIVLTSGIPKHAKNEVCAVIEQWRKSQS
jgi:hypothetical protein